MKQVLRGIIAPASGDLNKVLLAREYLQARTLEALQDQGVFQRWAFVGGTALRFLFSIPRFSEDLDFSLFSKTLNPDFDGALNRIQSLFKREGYDVIVAAKSLKTVASAFIKFRGLLHEIGLSPHTDQVFSIKIEVDTNPPAGAVTGTTFVRRHVPLNLLHFDKASLLAGKIHALFSRKYTKGRDVFDLLWYLGDRSWPGPNCALLNHALQQTGWQGPALTPGNWRGLLRDRLAAANWQAVRDDVRPFLERPADADLITLSTLESVLTS